MTAYGCAFTMHHLSTRAEALPTTKIEMKSIVACLKERLQFTRLGGPGEILFNSKRFVQVWKDGTLKWRATKRELLESVQQTHPEIAGDSSYSTCTAGTGERGRGGRGGSGAGRGVGAGRGGAGGRGGGRGRDGRGDARGGYAAGQGGGGGRGGRGRGRGGSGGGSSSFPPLLTPAFFEPSGDVTWPEFKTAIHLYTFLSTLPGQSMGVSDMAAFYAAFPQYAAAKVKPKMLAENFPRILKWQHHPSVGNGPSCFHVAAVPVSAAHSSSYAQAQGGPRLVTKAYVETRFPHIVAADSGRQARISIRCSTGHVIKVVAKHFNIKHDRICFTDFDVNQSTWSQKYKAVPFSMIVNVEEPDYSDAWDDAYSGCSKHDVSLLRLMNVAIQKQLADSELSECNAMLPAFDPPPGCNAGGMPQPWFGGGGPAAAAATVRGGGGAGGGRGGGAIGARSQTSFNPAPTSNPFSMLALGDDSDNSDESSGDSDGDDSDFDVVEDIDFDDEDGQEHDDAYMQNVAPAFQSGFDDTGSPTQQLRYLDCQFQAAIGEALGASAAAEPTEAELKNMWTNEFFLNKAIVLKEAVKVLQTARTKTDPWIQEKETADDRGELVGGKHFDTLLETLLDVLDIVHGTLRTHRDKAIKMCRRKIDKLEEMRERRDEKRERDIEKMGEEAYKARQEERRARRKEESESPVVFLTFAQSIQQLEDAIWEMEFLNYAFDELL